MPIELNSYPPAGQSTHEYTVELTGKEYILRFTWFDRPASWYVDLMEPDETPLVQGARVVIGWDIWTRAQDPRMPGGRLIPIPIDGLYEDPLEQDSLGVTTSLLYYEPGELESTATESTVVIVV